MDYTVWRRGAAVKDYRFLLSSLHYACRAGTHGESQRVGSRVQMTWSRTCLCHMLAALPLVSSSTKGENKNTVAIMRNNKIMCVKALSKLPGSGKCLINVSCCNYQY